MGYFQNYIIVSSLILIHEIGHFLCAFFMGFELDKIYLYPFGGISKFYIPFNCSIYKELLVLIMGPIFQIIASIILSILFDSSIVYRYHISILLFNLLPIYPLDGGKIVHLLFHFFFSFQKSFKISIFISYLLTILLLFYYKKISISVIAIYILLILLIRREEKHISYYYQKFLLERIAFTKYPSRIRVIMNPESFYRYFHNILFYQNQFIDEKEYLIKKYGNFKKRC